MGKNMMHGNHVLQGQQIIFRSVYSPGGTFVQLVKFSGFQLNTYFHLAHNDKESHNDFNVFKKIY